ncbi:MAG: PAS domain-containing sensor histidine kinase [Actinomycetota bacterium]
MSEQGTDDDGLAVLLGDLDIVVWEADPRSMSFRFVSDSAERLTGWSAASWIAAPRALAERMHPDDRPEVLGAFLAAGEGGSLDVEHRVVGADGEVRWFRTRGRLVGRGPGAVVRGTMIDVTAERSEMSAREEADRRFRGLVEQLPAIVYTENVSDDGLQVIYINPRVGDVLGITPEEWIADPSVWQRSLHPDDVDAVLAENSRSETTGDPFEIEYRMIARDGRVVWFHDVAMPVRDPDGDPVYWQGVMTDITPRKRAEERVAEAEGTAERLREDDEIKNAFLRAVSHDLRGPLAAILGLANTLEREDIALPDEEARDLASRIAENARRLDRIVADLLDLDRLERGALTAALAPLDIGATVRELVAGSDVVAGRRLDLDTAPLTIPADAVMVERIVDNLLRNAVRHTPGDSRIWVRVERMDDGALIVVEDDGPGVDADDRLAVFEAFRQGAGPSLAQGVGVGLAVVSRFARLHGGRAWVDERPGGGASFRVLLPGSTSTGPAPFTPARPADGARRAGGGSGMG